MSTILVKLGNSIHYSFSGLHIVLLKFILDIWIVGDSIPYWVGVHARSSGRADLRIPGKTVSWLCTRGIGWHDFRHTVEVSVLLSRPPETVVVSLGGNDLVNFSIRQIQNLVSREVKYLRSAFPNVTIVWVDILPRREWRGEHSGWSVIDSKRKRLNRLCRQLIRSQGKSAFVAVDIRADEGFYSEDGVHLNLVGKEFFLDTLREALINL